MQRMRHYPAEEAIGFWFDGQPLLCTPRPTGADANLELMLKALGFEDFFTQPTFSNKLNGSASLHIHCINSF
ncbi:unnamed protein product [Protopolystoma xenopodis]|uniref:Uncharacterized protein n=1 Tax=Protopolystoma xenopodis TaxID=117903 RepID=A0A448WYK3_9PLAT|nr:unnamed protein product [Protopolystoma xenopodis]